jgi:hypothetical protein
LNEKHAWLQQSNKPNEIAIRPAMPEFGYQESQLVACRIAPRHAAFASLQNILAPMSDALLAVNSISKLCLEMCVNVFGRRALLAEKPNDDSLVVLRPLNEKS